MKNHKLIIFYCILSFIFVICFIIFIDMKNNKQQKTRKRKQEAHQTEKEQTKKQGTKQTIKRKTQEREVEVEVQV